MGAQFIFRLGGKGFSKETALDSYRVAISIRKPCTTAEKLLFVAKSFICNVDSPVHVNEIITDPSVDILIKKDKKGSD